MSPTYHYAQHKESIGTVQYFLACNVASFKLAFYDKNLSFVVYLKP